MDQLRTNQLMTKIGTLLQDEGVTGREYLMLLHIMAVNVLAENPKALEHAFVSELKRDTLKLRLAKLKEKNDGTQHQPTSQEA